MFSDKEKFKPEIIIGKIQAAQYAVVAGAQICDTGFGATARLKLEILD